MNYRTALVTTGLIAASLVSGTAHAVLQGRNMDGNALTFEAYYDTDLNITWLGNANYAKTSGYDTDGAMTWAAANTWAANLSFYNPLTNQTYADWRLPTTTDTGALGAQCTYSGTDCGYNVDTASSEMAHLYFVTLGNQSYYTTTGAVSGAYAGGANPNSTLDNVGPFTNFQSYVYWSGTEYAPNPSVAWGFDTGSGYQYYDSKANSFYALAVSPGDVAAVPEAETYALMLAGLGLIGWRARRRG
ncbi:MAG: DUF1566 domain-containing protein [Thiobacillaceae bacterium]